MAYDRGTLVGPDMPDEPVSAYVAPSPIVFGSGAPSGSGDFNGQVRERTDNGDVHQWDGSSWVLQDNITGATGATGTAGATGATGAQGDPGADGAAGSRWYFQADEPNGTPPVESPNDGDIVLLTGDGSTYQYNGETWVLVGTIGFTVSE